LDFKIIFGTLFKFLISLSLFLILIVWYIIKAKVLRVLFLGLPE
jgi:hypothetical protein